MEERPVWFQPRHDNEDTPEEKQKSAEWTICCCGLAALPFVTGSFGTGPSLGKGRNGDNDMAFRNCAMGMAAVLLLAISAATRLLLRQGNAPMSKMSKGVGRELGGDYGKPDMSYFALDDQALIGNEDRPFDCLIVGCGPGGGLDQWSLH